MDFPHLTDLSEKDVKGKRVLVRAEFNVPVKHGEIVDDFRIRKALPTISFLTSRGAKVVLVSHISNASETSSLKHVHAYLSKSLDLAFVEDVENLKKSVSEMSEGDVVLLDNLRLFEGEIEANSKFAKQIASAADIYVNDAFSASHRKHVSIVEVPKLLPSYAGLQFIEEVEELSRVTDPEHPFLLILGGAKAGTKLPLARSFVERADFIYIAGALANVLFEAKGYEVGNSLVPDLDENYSDLIVEEHVVLPRDVVCQSAEGVAAKPPSSIEAGDEVVDIGRESFEELAELVEEAGFILWNGPLGFVEKGFDETTRSLAEIISESAAESIVGGGDTLKALQGMDREESFSFVSTAGGAMIDFLANGTLPGIDALRRSASMHKM